MPKKKTVIMPVSITPDEKDDFHTDAKFMGMTVSEFVRYLRKQWKEGIKK